jgi:hypothetical protein
MRTVKCYVLALAILAVATLGLSFWLSVDKGRPFWISLLVNVVAGLFGLALGIVLTVKIASRLAKQKLDKLSRPLVGLVSQLREHGTISSKAARACVMLAVDVISESSLLRKRFNSGASVKTPCAVCAMPAETLRDAGRICCKHCRLPGDVWTSIEVPGES